MPPKKMTKSQRANLRLVQPGRFVNVWWHSGTQTYLVTERNGTSLRGFCAHTDSVQSFDLDQVVSVGPMLGGEVVVPRF